MPDRNDDLRATAESVAVDARRLAALEEQKLELDPSDPEVGRISDTAQRVATGIALKTGAELALSEEIAAGGGRDGEPGTTGGNQSGE